ncbi:MAG TPA: hypothetical protein VHH72_11325 [Solirubrobacterales bacterium]|nr:hypothetical protein [Solirubrobacterales bacterium]
MRALVATALLVIVAVSVIAIARSDSDDEESAPDQEPPPAETADPLPSQPPGWGKVASAAGGFALGVPPGWSQKSSGESVTLKSPGSTVVIRVTADRDDEALDSDLDAYATALLDELGASEGRAGDGLEVASGYQVASVSGRRAAAPGAPAGSQGDRLEVVVVRRPELAAYPILIASDAGVKPAELDPIVARVVSSLRGRPVS